MIVLMVDDKTALPQPMTVEENGRTVVLETVGEKWSYPRAFYPQDVESVENSPEGFEFFFSCVSHVRDFCSSVLLFPAIPRIQEKAANAGFDWEKPEDVWSKVDEENMPPRSVSR